MSKGNRQTKLKNNIPSLTYGDLISERKWVAIQINRLLLLAIGIAMVQYFLKLFNHVSMSDIAFGYLMRVQQKPSTFIKTHWNFCNLYSFWMWVFFSSFFPIPSNIKSMYLLMFWYFQWNFCALLTKWECCFNVFCAFMFPVRQSNKLEQNKSRKSLFSRVSKNHSIEKLFT